MKINGIKPNIFILPKQLNKLKPYLSFIKETLNKGWEDDKLNEKDTNW